MAAEKDQAIQLMQRTVENMRRALQEKEQIISHNNQRIRILEEERRQTSVEPRLGSQSTNTLEPPALQAVTEEFSVLGPPKEAGNEGPSGGNQHWAEHPKPVPAQLSHTRAAAQQQRIHLPECSQRRTGQGVANYRDQLQRLFGRQQFGPGGEQLKSGNLRKQLRAVRQCE